MLFFNFIIIFLLVHKQNKIINALYELQSLQEEKEKLSQEKKELVLIDQKGKQLSSIQAYAKNNLHMVPIKLKETQAIDAV